MVVALCKLQNFVNLYIYGIFQCDPEDKRSCDAGCNGGLMTNAFEYTLKAGGLMREKDYPYTGRDRGTCKLDKSKIAASVSNFSVVSLDEDQIAANMVKHGPLAGSLAHFVSLFLRTGYIELNSQLEKY